MRRFSVRVVRRTSAAVAMAFLALVPQAQASGVPVIDAAAITQAVKSFTETVKLVREAEKQVSELQEQVVQLDQIIADLTGTRGMSDLLNGSAEGAKRRYADTGLGTFIDLAAGTGGLEAGASDLETAAAAIISDYGFRTGAQMVPSAPTGSRAKSVDLIQGTTVAAMTVGERAFDGTGDRLASIEGLIGAIDGTPDLKASVDLNTRMQGQVALLLNEMLMLQGMQLHSTGVTMGVEAADKERAVTSFSFDPVAYDNLNAPTSP